MRFGPNGGPETGDPGRFTCENCTLSELVLLAYDLKHFQLTAPSWMNSERFEIVAKVPEGASKEQFRQMIRTLLAERFKLKVHRETKEMPIYELTVAKGGPRMKESTEQRAGPESPPPVIFAPRGASLRPDGCPAVPVARMMTINGRTCLQASGETMEHFVIMLSYQVANPVTDGTGLKGKYDFNLMWAPDTATGMPAPMPGGGAAVFTAREPAGMSPDGDPAPTLFAALRQQLGLRLEQKKGAVEVIVVDSADKVPTEN